MSEPITIRVREKSYSVTTTHVRPPIPSREWDWCAYVEGEEEAGNYGWGETKSDAVADLIINMNF